MNESNQRHPKTVVLILTVLIGVAALVGGLIYNHARERSDQSQRASTIYVIGDSYTSGSNEGGVGPKGWPELVVNRLGDQYTLVDAAVGGSGYASLSPTGKTFDDLARSLPVGGDGSLVVVFGSRNDAGLEYRQKAIDTFATIRERQPSARILVIGTPWVSAQVPAPIMTVRDTLRSAAVESGVPFFDPIAARWFFDRPDLIGADGIHPTDQGHRYLADRIGPLIAAALKQN